MRHALLAAALLLAQSPPSAPQAPQTPTFRGGTNVVLVDVSVVGRDNRDVEDLTAADFEVLDDGLAVPITSFRHITGWERNAAAELYPVRTVEDEEREAARDDVRLFAIFLDEYHVARMQQLRVIPPLIDFVRALPPADLVAVYFPGLSALDIRFTRDRDAVIRAIRAFQGRQGVYTPTKYPFEEEHLRHPMDIERLRMEVTVSSVIGAIVHLDTLKEGRKSLLLVTEGVADVIDMYRTANQSNVAVYPLDPQGLGVGPSRGAQDGLRVLADQTGGRAFVNMNDFRRALSRVLDDSGAYYLIGYVSPRPNDGRFHTIAVRVKRPQLTLNARKGYWALTAAQAAQAAAPPSSVPRPVQEALNALADSLRPDAAEQLPASPNPASRDADPVSTILGVPTVAVRSPQLRDPTARRAFARTERIAVRAPVNGPPATTVTARLLSRLGQPLVDLPVTLDGRSCELMLALGNLGAGDYVIELSARDRDRLEQRYVAFRLR